MSTRQAALWAYLARFVSYAIQLLTSIVIARLLQPQEVGVFGVGFAVAAMITVFKEFGAITFLIREPELTTAKVQTMFGVMLLIYSVLGGLVALASPIAADIYAEPRLIPIMLLLSVSIMLIPFGGPAAALLQRELNFFPLFVAQIAASVASGAVGVTLAALGHGPISLGWATIAGAATLSGVQLAFKPDHLRLRPSLAHWRPMFRYGSWLSLSSLITSVFSRLPDLLLARLIGFAAVGFFGRAAMIVEAVSTALVAGATSAMFPAFSKLHGEGKSLAEPYIRLLTLLTGLVWPFFAAIALLAEPLVLILFGPTWAPAAPVLRALAITQIILSGVTLHYSLLLIHGRTRLLFFIELMQSSVGIILFCGGAWWGLEMAALSRIPYACFFLITYVILTQRLTGYALRDLMQAYARSGAVAAGVAVLIGMVGPERPEPVIVTCVLAGMLGLAIGAAVGHPAIDELRRLSWRRPR